MRNVLALWTRKGQPVRTLSYTKIDHAIPKLTRHVMQKAEPGDVIEIIHRHTELHLGTLKVKVGGLTSSWIWDQPIKAA